ncbi:YbgA family protein [Teredinibacter haidensis]|uniref:YbgA family protein n=1 Tax=Teredinibacter haidensis TaxID=2731755 RepID=UPI000948E5CA|nr:DUF523 and DUF1722 domain-containing protein [Teredinibacter haidensis]
MDSPHPITIRVGISACLLGDRVRYDGGHKHDKYITQTLGNFFEFSHFCPEVSIGLGIPREPIRIVLEGDLSSPVQRVLGTKDTSKEFTQELKNCADAQQEWVANLCGYIFKKDSPSCGMARVKAYHNEHPTRKGVGLFSSQLMSNNPLLPCEEEGRLHDLPLRENFIERVYVYHRWKQLLSGGLTAKALITFHARHKYLLMSHSQKAYRELGRYLSNIPGENLDAFGESYITQLMAALTQLASRKNHVNVLMHIFGYLKNKIDGDDKKEILRAIETCRIKSGPLTIPRTLLRHHFRKHPNSYIDNSYYLSPYPDELNF